jgi:hypothetical protein
MKKKMKKLALSKETVRDLAKPVLGKIAGGTGQTYGYQCLTWLCPTSDGRFECAFACIEPGDGPN